MQTHVERTCDDDGTWRACIQVDENGVPLDARQQQLQRLVAGKDPTGGDQPWAKKAMEKAYAKHYDDYRRHRVWYQVMAFAPRTIVKNFNDLSLFRHEIEPWKRSAILTLRDGQALGERIETRIRLSRGKAHLQESVVHIPGVGDLRAKLLATNNVLMPGLHGVDCLTLAVLPWGEKPIERAELVPEAIAEVTFDFPAILLPPVVEVIKKGLTKAEREAAAEAKEAEKDAAGGSPKRKGSIFRGGRSSRASIDRVAQTKKAGVKVKYLMRDTYVKTFEVKSRSRIEVEEALERRRLAKIRSEKGWFGIGKSRAGRLADAKVKKAAEKEKKKEQRRAAKERQHAKREAKARKEKAAADKDGEGAPPAPNTATTAPDVGLSPVGKKKAPPPPKKGLLGGAKKAAPEAPAVHAEAPVGVEKPKHPPINPDKAAAKAAKEAALAKGMALAMAAKAKPKVREREIVRESFIKGTSMGLHTECSHPFSCLFLPCRISLPPYFALARSLSFLSSRLVSSLSLSLSPASQGGGAGPEGRG